MNRASNRCGQACFRRSVYSRSTSFEVTGPLGHLLVRVTSRLAPRQRRELGVAFFRQIRPFLEYFRAAAVTHSESMFRDQFRAEQRGLTLFSASAWESATGRLGFGIRMRRLEKRWSQRDLAIRTGLSDRHLSRIERGLCFPQGATLRRLAKALGASIGMPPRGKVEKVECAKPARVSVGGRAGPAAFGLRD
jgi:hypothetical protein